jgi:endoglucanase Acf2
MNRSTPGLGLLIILLLSQGVFQAAPAYAAIESVGQGSYTTTLPPGAKGPSNSSGGAVTPVRTSNVTGATPTNDWSSSIPWKFQSNSYSENMYPHPLALRAKSGGLGVSYPTNPSITNGTPAYVQEYHYAYAEDLMLGVAGLAAPDTKLDGYSEWTVTAAWSDGARTLKATFGHGLPFVYATKSGGDAVITFNGAPTIWANNGAVLGVTINGHHYGIFAPTGATWSGSGTLQSNLNGKDYFSVAVLPGNTTAILDLYKKYAYSFVTGSSVSWNYNTANARVTTNYTVTTSAKEGAQTGTLLALYRHQWRNTSAALTNYTYISPRGTMKVLEGASFSTGLTFNGVLPALPDKGTYDRATLINYVNEIGNAANLFPPSPEGTTDTYWTGKALGRLAALIPIAEQVGNTAARDRFLQEMKNKLQDWFTATDNTNLFYYDTTWGTLIGYPANYGSDTQLNDHHFHYAYYVIAAATIAQYDPAWASNANWGGMVNLLIKDAANIDNADTRFPRLRSFDPYAGHSWAAGHAGFGAGNNQESTSESINFSTALIRWGTATGDTALRDLGIYLYTTAVSAIEQYWFDVDNEVFPAGYNRSAVGILWGDGGAYATFFGADPEFIHGINYLPITGGSLYLGRNPGYITTSYNELRTNNGGEEDTWRDITWSYQALADPGAALAKFNSNSGYTPEWGETKAHTYHWLHNLNAMGRVDTSVTANIPTYAVFNKAGAQTYVAYNPGASPIIVTFSDGTQLNVGARAMATSGGGSGGGGGNGTGTGLKGEYYDNIDFTSPKLTRTDATVGFDWGGGSPDPSIGVDTFSVRWTGQVQPRFSETYTFFTTSDDGVRLRVNGQLLIDKWIDQGPTEHSGTIALTAGQKYDITIEYYERGGGAVAKLAWSSARQAKEMIAQTQLYPAASATPKSNTLYVIDGAATNVAGALAFSGGGASTDTAASAGGANHDGAPNNPLVYTVSGVSGTYNASAATAFSLFVDAGANVGAGVQARVSYDFTGDGVYDRVETFNYFATNDVAGWEQYTQVRGLKSATGSFANLANGRVKLEAWNAIGAHTTTLRTGATAADGSQSLVTIPFTGIQ